MILKVSQVICLPHVHIKPLFFGVFSTFMYTCGVFVCLWRERERERERVSE